MVLLKAQRLQIIARQLARLQAELESEGGELRKVEEGLEETASRARVDLQTVRRLDLRSLVELLTVGQRPDPGRMWAVAEVLYLDALAARAAGEDSAARDRLRKARALYRRAGSGLELPHPCVRPEERLAEIGRLAGGE